MSHPASRLSMLSLLLLLPNANLQEEKMESFRGTEGEHFNMRFVFNSSIAPSSIKGAGLYKDGKKINEYIKGGQSIGHHRILIKLEGNNVTVRFNSLQLSDSGVYHIGLSRSITTDPLTLSSKVNLTVSERGNGTEAPTTPTQEDIPNQISYIIIASGATVLILLVVVGYCLYLATHKNTGPPAALTNPTPRTKIQDSEMSRGLPVYSIEYGVLEFPGAERRVEGEGQPVVQDNVEYATITFPPCQNPRAGRGAQSQLCCGRVR
ncbi:uncharacterized protein [Lepisosteus oculatus]|uniref:uncharacterized protein n=1 Tax=Lepisosteus oculatus TaxID=7918 RepID=UPI0035F507DA